MRVKGFLSRWQARHIVSRSILGVEAETGVRHSSFPQGSKPVDGG